MMHRLLVLTTAASLLAAGCNTPGARLNAPPHGRACETSDLQGTYTYMGDNALLADRERLALSPAPGVAE